MGEARRRKAAELKANFYPRMLPYDDLADWAARKEKEGGKMIAFLGLDNGLLLIGQMEEAVASSLKTANSAPVVVDLIEPAKVIIEGVPVPGELGGIMLQRLASVVSLCLPAVSIKRDAIKFYSLEPGQVAEWYEKVAAQMKVGRQ